MTLDRRKRKGYLGCAFMFLVKNRSDLGVGATLLFWRFSLSGNRSLFFPRLTVVAGLSRNTKSESQIGAQ